jgi:dynein intermediate chain 1, axonemal
VYAVKWNPYHEDVFLSCSADWTIKMWKIDMKRPIVTFDLENEIGDIAWAPYSSTVFAAVTSTANQEGRLYVYDLDQDKHQELSCMPTTKKSKALHVAFNMTGPYILVGDQRGGVISFKLPNSLFRGPVQPDPENEADKGKTVVDMERAKMEKYLGTQDKEEYILS